MSTLEPSSTTSEARGTSADWQTRFGRYLQRAADTLEKTAELNREMVKRIACGDIAPVTVESQLAAFMATEAESFAEEMADVVTEFLGRLIDVNSWYARALVDPRRPETPAPPSAEEWRFDHTAIDWFDRLDAYARAETASLQRILPDGETTDALPTTVAATTDALLDLLTRLEDVNATYGRRYLEAVLGLARESDTVSGTLHAVAPLGETATVRFAVCNNTEQRADIRCVLSDVRRSDGVGPAFDPDATIMPNGIRLSAGKEEVFTLSIRLADSDFTAGPDYRGGVRVIGMGDSAVDIPVAIRASLAEEPR
ncbi:MAG: hypothetical protein QOJ95_770 [Mycobacterium sp.]|jgi:hypothetical protein|nr:hypothetical protein [Mycobacterium sp.]MDT5176572.1 hypothetical protein [Mycobacterium sp.]